MQPASCSPALTAVCGAGHAEHAFGNPPQLVAVDTHCMSALQPAVELQASTAVLHWTHLLGLHWQRSKAAASAGGGAASWAVLVLVDVLEVTTDVEVDDRLALELVGEELSEELVALVAVDDVPPV